MRGGGEQKKHAWACGGVCVDVSHLCLQACLARMRHGVSIAWYAQCFRKVSFRKARYRFAWQAQRFCKVKCRFRGRHITFCRFRGRCSTSAVRCRFRAGAALWQGRVQIARQAQQFRRAGAANWQGQVQISLSVSMLTFGSALYFEAPPLTGLSKREKKEKDKEKENNEEKEKEKEKEQIKEREREKNENEKKEKEKRERERDEKKKAKTKRKKREQKDPEKRREREREREKNKTERTIVCKFSRNFRPLVSPALC